MSEKKNENKPMLEGVIFRQLLDCPKEKEAILKVASNLLGTALSENCHLSSVISCLKTNSAILEIVANKLIKKNIEQKNKKNHAC